MSTESLGLYVHLPWCVSKCPYCDFNSHALAGALPVTDYLRALQNDLSLQREWFAERTVTSIFIGGGTPSLFPGRAIGDILDAASATVAIDDSAEITMEVNPGSVERDHLREYRLAGVNRLSIGVQSFADEKLQVLERAHSSSEAFTAVEEARDAGFKRMNLDLMYGLPGQSQAEAAADIETALQLDPGHISHYQLTLEPNTRFAAQPPSLPDSDQIADMGEAGRAQMMAAGYQSYEISANALPGEECQHNLNYWRYGDYMAIGAGAHGKFRREDEVFRYRQRAQPAAYMNAIASNKLPTPAPVSGADQIFEYFLNRTRLKEEFSLTPIQPVAEENSGDLADALDTAEQRGLLEREADRFRCTARGHQYLNDLQALFLP